MWYTAFKHIYCVKLQTDLIYLVNSLEILLLIFFIYEKVFIQLYVTMAF